MSADAILAQDLVALAFCWRLERRDGVTIGLTSHDRDLVTGGVVYRAAPGLVPSAISTSIGLDPESMTVKGALTSDTIRETDLATGRWDGAALWLYLTEWTDPGTLWLELMRGELGAVEQQGEDFSVEISGAAAVLNGEVAPETSPSCRASLGDKACRIDLAGRRRLAVISGVAGDLASVTGGGLVPGHYVFGSLRWLEGGNCGLMQPIIANDATSVRLAEAPALPVTAGTRALILEGCDKQITTCSMRFANAINFRGEPYLPGSDLLTRYPGAS